MDMLQLLHQRGQIHSHSAASQGRRQGGGWLKLAEVPDKCEEGTLGHPRVWSSNGTHTSSSSTSRATTRTWNTSERGRSPLAWDEPKSRKKSEKETSSSWFEPPSKRRKSIAGASEASRLCGKNASWRTFIELPSKNGRHEKAKMYTRRYATQSTAGDARPSEQLGGSKLEKKDGTVELEKKEEQAGKPEERVVGQSYSGAGSMKRALEVASSPTLREEGIKDLKKNFWATSTLHVRKSRREEVMRLATEVNQHRGPIFPLTEEVIVGVAAALKAAGMKSGDQYLNELKLWHVEQGFEQPGWMIRCMGLCKKALTRGRGPEKRAAELNPSDITDERWAWKPSDSTLYVRPALSFTWACIWMLREIELANMRWKHVSVTEGSRTLKILLPISKTDQRGIGTRRTLTCCEEKTCHRMCPWKVWWEIVKVKPVNDSPEDMIFKDQKGKALTKLKTVTGWKGLTNVMVSGHSARRSGAMAYVRAGMPIQELAFLGRWKSAVVLRYAEDALQEIPANLKCKMDNRMKPAVPVTTKKKPEKETTSNALGAEDISLWVASNNYKKNRSWHLVKVASWQLSLEDWSTCCGWNFARCSANVSFLTNLGFNHNKCSKCKEWYSTRDFVKEERTLACATANGFQRILRQSQ